MGIIAKQTIQSSFFSYLGVILGGINVAILYPRIFSEEQIGLINILLALSAIFAQFSSLGVNGVTNYFFHYFNDKIHKHHGFFSIILVVMLVGFTGFLIFFGIFEEQILKSQVEETLPLSDYGIYVIPLTFFTLAFIVFDVYATVLAKSVIGFFLKEFVFRIVNLGLILAYNYKLIDFPQFLFWYIAGLGMPPLVIGLELMRKGHIFISRPDKSLLKKHRSRMFNVGGYYILDGFGNMLVTNIDRWMINVFLGLGATGIYSVTNYVGMLVQIPRRSMGKVAAPMLARLWAEEKHDELQKLFEKSSISQLLIGTYIFIGIWINIDAIFNVIPQNYSSGKWVIFYIGLANLFQCFLGFGGLLITTSRFYRMRTYFTFLLGLIVIVTNAIFIPVWGISGAAMASALSKLLFVVFNMAFLHLKMGILPLLRQHLIIPFIGGVSYFSVWMLPIPDVHWVIELIINSILISIIYISLTIVSKVVPDAKKFFTSF